MLLIHNVDSGEGNVPPTTGYVAEKDDTGATGRRRGEGGGPLERVTVNLSARASRALELITRLTGDSKTDVINRALQVYAFFEESTANGGALYLQESKDAPQQLVKIF